MTLLGEYITKAIEEQAVRVPLMSTINQMAGPLWASYRQAKEYGARCEADCQRKFPKQYLERNLCQSQCQVQTAKRETTALKSLLGRCGTDQQCREKIQDMINERTQKLQKLNVRLRYYQEKVRQARLAASPRVLPAPR